MRCDTLNSCIFSELETEAFLAVSDMNYIVSSVILELLVGEFRKYLFP